MSTGKEKAQPTPEATTESAGLLDTILEATPQTTEEMAAIISLNWSTNDVSILGGSLSQRTGVLLDLLKR